MANAAITSDAYGIRVVSVGPKAGRRNAALVFVRVGGGGTPAAMGRLGRAPVWSGAHPSWAGKH
jgi:hypothetical protein